MQRQNTALMQRQIRMAQNQMRQHKARVGQRGQQPVNVGACGSPWQPSPFYAGQWGAQWGPNVPHSDVVPQNAPNVPPQMLASPTDIIRANQTSFSIRAQAAANNAVVTVEGNPIAGLFYTSAVRSCNECNEIDIQTITTGGSSINRLAGPTDAVAWNTIECQCPVDWGCISSQNPIRISFSAVGTPSVAPFLTLILFGTRDESFNSCYPGLPAAVGLLPGAYGWPSNAPG